MFRVPDSSSPPATPNRQRKNDSRFSAENPSTTPAGPPPSSFTAASTTPSGPPPSSAVGSSQYRSAIPFSTSLHNTSDGCFHMNDVGEDDRGDYDAMDEDEDLFSIRDSADSSAARPLDLSNISAVAKGMGIPTKALLEPDLIILQTEQITENMIASVSSGDLDDEQKDNLLATAAQHFLKLWKDHTDAPDSHSGIGPGDLSDPLTKSVFLSSLLLSLQHPSRRKALLTDSFSASRTRHQSRAPTPEILLAWLRNYHNPFPEDLAEVFEFEPNPVAHERFWDVLYSCTLRGNLKDTINLLNTANLRFAWTALEDGSDRLGYQGNQLGNAQRAVNRLIQVLESCPAVTNNDWDVRGEEWNLFRKRINQAVEDLELFAEGSSQDREAVQEPFQAENFGMSSISNGMSLSSASRRVESKVPWTLYQNLNYVYGQLLGTHDEILAASGDWVEASIGLTVWWNGEEEDEGQENLAASRHSHFRSRNNRKVDISPVVAYRERLSSSLDRVLAESEEPELQVNTMSSVEVGLACIFENDIEGVIGILRSFSSVVSTAVVELGKLGEWLPDLSTSNNIMKGFDQSDLMVLSYVQKQPKDPSRDDVLLQFSRLLLGKNVIQDKELNIRREGWEMAVEVLGRLDNINVAQDEIARILDSLNLSSSERVGKIVALCSDMGLVKEARRISEKYADNLTQTSNSFGEALYYYARAHEDKKLRDVLDTLVSLCLVQSTSYPPISELDERLKSMISSPKHTFAQLSSVDGEAADMLSTNLSGYATIRKFYDLRDEELYQKAGEKTTPQPIKRKKEAATALVAAISSAADGIYGGLYDNATGSVLKVDTLLVLLGEALPFVNRERRILSLKQCFTVLKAVEDISIVSRQIFAECETCFRSTIANAHGSDPPSPQALLRKSTSGLSEMSQFSLLGSSMLDGSNEMDEGSGVLVKSPVKRAWDWRSKFQKDAEAEDVLRILRLGLTREVSRAWTEGDV